MFALAIFGLAAGAWLLDSAVQNRNPVTSLVDIIRDPSSARVIAKDSAGGAFTVDRGPSATGAAAGNTGAYDSNADNGVNGTTVTANSVSAGALAYARAQIGKPYVLGATGPNAFDCSGLVFRAFEHVGVKLPGWPRPNTQTIMSGIATGKLTRVSRADLQVGDLVFPTIAHVGIYSGNGKFVEAPNSLSKVREVNVWGFLTAGRVKPTGNPSGSVGGKAGM